ncbi:Thiol-disulfide isomerase or thioredoxin [Salegentibacter echinorum]|uniref:Thiol-disulfide isomerase or thioredoxin n=1 Tax=Salegentibacter echinorum TaxID=1073325 RepID=A0A1M5CHT2_SALEC|nr:redoxin domain-containing protein [Salegentibacter echinorum]SHF54324.1 Thiol-disulfide isomerase or thioredoxin [Salegentibacter echinorum]
MKRTLLLFFLCIAAIKLQAQMEENTKIYFSTALAMHLPEYDEKAKLAYWDKDYRQATSLFENFVDQYLKGTYIDNFKFLNLKNREVSLYSFKKPVYLLTYASWCVPGKGEIPALNELAYKYKDSIDFVVVFWDTRDTAKQLSEQFQKSIQVLYVDETQNKHDFVLRKLKHSLGLPTCYLIAGNRQIIDVRRSVFHPYHISEEKSFKMNYEAIEAAISEIISERKSSEIKFDNLEDASAPD